jgi:hypothetical protein
VQVRCEICPLFTETFANHPEVLDKITAFMAAKTSDPLAVFGGGDTQFSSKVPLGIAVPKLRHANLSNDIRLFYTIGGRDPTVFKLYAVYSHDESGTGQPSNIKRQKNAGKQMANQAFEPLHKK